MATKGREQRLRGRTGECETLRSLISNVQSAQSQVLVLRGEPGVGKTSLLEFVSGQSAGFRIARVAGIESDMELAFAGLQQLCAPLMDHAHELPEPQREALAVAFGLGIGPTPDRFLVGLAVLSLMAAAADEQPLLCVIDDAQWLDQVSVQTLGFVARRLLAEPVALVFAVRDGGADALVGLPEMPIAGLSDGDARDLLESVTLGRIDERVRDRIVAETRGIPLALLQVPHNLSTAELAGGFGFTSDVRPSAGQIEESFIRRIRSLPDHTQRLVLLAAAEPVGDAALFLRAAEQLNIPVEALAPAEAAEVIEFGPRMRFHHPLVRSAAYRAADLGDRRAVHRALADATDPQHDPDRRAWHAANAAAGPDDAVAAELKASASRAQSRGGVAAAATFLERAAILTADPDLRGARAIAAAQAKRGAADPAAAYELLALAELSPLSDLQRAQIARLRAQMEFTRSRGGEPGAMQIREASSLLLDAAKRLETFDDELARDTYLEAIAAAMYTSRCEPGAVARVAEATCLAVERVSKLHRPIDFLLTGMAHRLTGGVREGSGPLRTALDLWGTHAQRNDGRSMRWITLAFPIVQESAAGELWDDTLMEHLADVMVRYARETGALASLPPAVAYRAGFHVLAGQFSTAATLLEEADAISAATNDRPVKYHKLLLAAWRGDHANAMQLIQAGSAEGAAKGEGRLLGLTGFSTALLYNGLGRYEEAFTAARQACEHEDLGFGSWCLLELIEAAARTGEMEAGELAVKQLDSRTRSSGTDWGLGTLASAQALLADNKQADALFNEAIERLNRTRIVVHLARTHLRYGEWLRRANRRNDARRHLGEAFDMFTRMGAQGFAERARRELVTTGEKVRKQPVSSGDQLTAQEAQIARLAADGLTNQEIGAQLFISTHTVEWHLRKVFVKLGITSRRQLRTVEWAG